MSGEQRVDIVIPTYNEADNLETLVASLLDAVPHAGIVIVDDASPDGTGEIADRLASLHAPVRVVHRSRKEGIGPAYAAGFDRALSDGADLIVQMDADFSHRPADVPRLLVAAREAELVLGSRYVEGGEVGRWGRLRRWISRSGSAYARLWLGLRVRDLTGGFKCYRREVVETIDPAGIGARGYGFQVETTYRAILADFRVVELPIHFEDRRVGESKMSNAIVFEAIWRVPLMRLRGRRFRRRG
ncbi:MAG: polyprenol monophosphomannose synthase [Solirubrobacterales bacterium]